MHNLIETPLALLAGLLTIASPCVLPVLPILLGTAISPSGEAPSRTRPLFIIAGFILSFSAFAMLLGAVWTPCAGPVLASILVLVVKAQDLGWSSLLLLMYAIGAALPMLAILYSGQYMSSQVRVIARYSERLQQLFGVLVIVTACAIYLQYDVLVTVWLSSLFSSHSL